jgi:putative membrane protein
LQQRRPGFILRIARAVAVWLVATTARHAAIPRKVLVYGAAAIACLVVGMKASVIAAAGPLTRHMMTHIVLMNAVAPLLALAIAAMRRVSPVSASGRSLAAASLVQLALLWGWHAPAALAAAHRLSALHALAMLSLSAAALWFWLAVILDRSAVRWRALLALLLTGKLFCLLGVLLVFAPRPLYAAGSPIDLADQQLAGLLMVVACPLSFVVAAVIIAALGLRDMARAASRPAHVSVAGR